MTSLLNAGIGLFAVVITLPALYLAFLGAVTLVARPKTPVSRRGTGSLGFAILVPAHNEAELVGGTVDRLLRLRHPADRVSVHVVADNCTDDTAAVARERGACVHERTDARRRGKGAALNWLADQVFSEIPRVDAFVVVDADSELSNDFVGVMSDHLRAGDQTIQALHLVAVSEDRPLIRIRELAFHLGNHLRPLAHTILGGSSGLHGTGMCFAADIARRYRWSESSVVEDGELFLRLVRDGHRVALATGATVRQTVPASFAGAGAQAVRWERVRFDHFVAGARLAAQGARRRNPSALFAGLSILVPPTAVLATAGGLAIVMGALVGSAALAVLGAVALVALVGYAARGAALAGMAPRVLLRILLWAPPYAIWKLYVVALAATGTGRGEWARSTRAAQL